MSCTSSDCLKYPVHTFNISNHLSILFPSPENISVWNVMNNLGLMRPTVGGVNLPWLLKLSVGSVGGKLMRYLCYRILAGCIIIRCCRAWRDVGLPSESGNRVVVNAEPETRAECASSFHVSTGRTLVLTIRPRGPMFVFTAFRYCSAAQFNLGGICKQYRKACCVVCARVCMDEQVRDCCVCVFESTGYSSLEHGSIYSAPN